MVSAFFLLWSLLSFAHGPCHKVFQTTTEQGQQIQWKNILAQARSTLPSYQVKKLNSSVPQLFGALKEGILAAEKMLEQYQGLNSLDQKVHKKTHQALLALLTTHLALVSENQPNRQSEFIQMFHQLPELVHESPEVSFFLLQREIQKHYRIDELLNCRLG